MPQKPSKDLRDTQPVSHVQWIHREKLHPNGYNPNAVAPPELELLITSILEDGWTQPVVRIAREDGEWDIVDGFHRWKVSADPRLWERFKGYVPTVEIIANKEHRMMSTVRHNRARGVHGILPMGRIVTDLKAEGLSDEEICKRLGMEVEEIERLVDRAGMPTNGSKNKNGQFSNSWKPKARK